MKIGFQIDLFVVQAELLDGSLHRYSSASGDGAGARGVVRRSGRDALGAIRSALAGARLRAVDVSQLALGQHAEGLAAEGQAVLPVGLGLRHRCLPMGFEHEHAACGRASPGEQPRCQPAADAVPLRCGCQSPPCDGSLIRRLEAPRGVDADFRLHRVLHV